ncbi:DUF459 domain-containing protein [Devosia sp.]|uniref:SGNH/GDSL hydrolase family protein n=1 Tax=Devosia sp. TaxID=1871048 RepID=UPI002AFE5200|nr:DUF459 domain-containing protein [Devosia sp.]
MIRLALVLLAGLLVLGEMAPAFAQDRETVLIAQEQKRRTLFDLLFGPPEPAAPVQAPQQRTQQRAPAASLPPPKPQVTKAEDATRLAVFGDSLAIDLSRALERFYAEDTHLAVIDQGVSSSGFVRDDYFDWIKAIDQQIAADSFDLAIVIIGINDRQEIRVDGKTYPALSEPWIAAYQARISTFLAKLRAAGKPVIWVGLPPMSKSDYSAAISQISNIHRMASFSGGAEFLDIYERFLGEDGRYSSQGPDVNGQTASMRKGDGIHFSAAGSDKIAFYLSQTISRFYRGGGIQVAVADPLAGTDAGAMLRPPYQGLGQTRLLEVAGAVIPISRVPARAGDLLTADAPGGAEPPFTLEQLVSAPVGRADAFGVGIDPAREELEF